MTPRDLSWRALPGRARVYVACVIASGAVLQVALWPREISQPLLFAVLLVASCLTSAWKVSLPIPVASSSTLSVSYAADLAALLLLGPRPAMAIAVAGALTQCTVNVRHPYPAYRTVFSVAAEAVTMAATGVVYVACGGGAGPLTDLLALARPLVACIATYFVVNTGLVAAAIALSSGRSVWGVWRHDFLWSGVSFIVAGTAGAGAAVVIGGGHYWLAILMLAPIYLTYRTYRIFVGRLDDQTRHVEETRRLHEEAVAALQQARDAERMLAAEKERLAAALAQMTRLEHARLQLLEREQAARAAAEEANRLKDEFLATVSHELRTPLNAILGWADMLRSGAVSDVRRERAFAAIYGSAKRQAQLIEELLDVARIMSGKLRLERGVVHVDDVIEGALEIVQPAADAKNIDVVLESLCSRAAIDGDSVRLQQIVWNLLSNAVKFTPNGGRIRLAVRQAGEFVELVVSDNGPGISKDFLPYVFEPFRQEDGSVTRAHGGLGLGLSIVKHVVELHGGTVEAQSDGAGATFTVRLPAIAVPEPPPGPAPLADSSIHAGGADRHSPLAGLTVLVVDDDEESRDVIAAYLESHQAATVCAACTDEALALIEHADVDILLADVAMPGEDGYALIRRLRAHPRAASIPAAALTAFARDEDRQRALDAGFDVHLAKPVDTQSLFEAVASLAFQRLTVRS